MRWPFGSSECDHENADLRWDKNGVTFDLENDELIVHERLHGRCPDCNSILVKDDERDNRYKLTPV